MVVGSVNKRCDDAVLPVFLVIQVPSQNEISYQSWKENWYKGEQDPKKVEPPIYFLQVLLDVAINISVYILYIQVFLVHY